MKQISNKRILPIVLAFLCGLFFVHFSTEIKKETSHEISSTIVNTDLFNETGLLTHIDYAPSSSDKHHAVEASENEEKEEEHIISPPQKKQTLSNISIAFFYAQALGLLPLLTEKSSVCVKALKFTIPYSRHIRFQIFRI
ncbi:hypothetical protein J8L85_05170 [Maribacter sp. MMG018]|uniref:hypothetical protein n=1 Tax=Maribacter sp. MMG018 TaxID=2822688 RepID=UPI001B39837C|nr:hypothetical protein [Maribacter sp. MMG018]MBQ4913817.1 hypothetical protein [Maribacter sp. MMG018]